MAERRMTEVRAHERRGTRGVRRHSRNLTEREKIALSRRKTHMITKDELRGGQKADAYLRKYGEFEAYNTFGGKSVREGVIRMRRFYQDYPDAPV